MLSEKDLPNTQTQEKNHAGFLSNLPKVLFLVALLAALAHLSPYLRAQTQTPDGWTFTGNIYASPDMMQYRTWTRQVLETGVLVDNRFTTEPNPPHLLVIFYYLIGNISELVNIPSEFVYAYTGAVLTFFIIILIYAFIRIFYSSSSQAWWVFGVIFLGGGLGAYLSKLSNYDFVRQNFFLRRIIAESVWTWPVFEEYRGSYALFTLFDTHYLLIWLVLSLALISLYFTLKKFTYLRLLFTTSIYFLATLLHVYEGVTLLVITIVLGLLFWWKKLAKRDTFITLLVCFAAVIVGLIIQWFLYQSSGLPVSDWRAKGILLSTLLISYPVAWILLAFGLVNYWKNAGMKEVFVIGWALGCLLITMSGPFYPYPDRGIMTLQIPLYIIAGAIFFSLFKRVTWPAVIALIVLIGFTLYWKVENLWENTAFNPQANHMFLTEDHQEIINTLSEKAENEDVLLIDKSLPPWVTDDLWLAPDYPGKFYCGHFFLTVNYEEKCQQVDRFYKGFPQEQIELLKSVPIRFVFLGPDENTSSFEQIPGLVPILENSAGSVLEYLGDDEASQ